MFVLDEAAMKSLGLKYYSSDIHRASFVLPNSFKKVVFVFLLIVFKIYLLIKSQKATQTKFAKLHLIIKCKTVEFFFQYFIMSCFQIMKSNETDLNFETISNLMIKKFIIKKKLLQEQFYVRSCLSLFSFNKVIRVCFFLIV